MGVSIAVDDSNSLGVRRTVFAPAELRRFFPVAPPRFRAAGGKHGDMSSTSASRAPFGPRAPRVRDFHDDDLDGVARLFEQVTDERLGAIYSLAEVVASCQKDHAVVAVEGDQVVGAAVARAAHAQGWLVFFGVDVLHERQQELAAGLLEALQRRLAPIGLGKLSALVPDQRAVLPLLTDNGFRVRQQLRYLERALPVDRRELEMLRQAGGRMLPAGLWDRLAGMHAEKALIDERLIAPLADPDLAARYGVVPPRTVMLFGPPGTGKTTFAKAIASRLGWPFVEVFPSRLAEAPGGIAAALRSTFETIAGLEHAVVFMDEVEEIAARRGDPPSPTQGVTNELLKLIPDFREQGGRLLICATNFVRALDAAFLRHGRFDYVFPIGLPDVEARAAMWRRQIPEEVVDDVEVARLVDSSAGLTPADIEYAARFASQSALARAIAAREQDAPEPPGPGTADYLRGLSRTRATVSPESIAEFEEDIAAFARV